MVVRRRWFCAGAKKKEKEWRDGFKGRGLMVKGRVGRVEDEGLGMTGRGGCGRSVYCIRRKVTAPLPPRFWQGDSRGCQLVETCYYMETCTRHKYFFITQLADVGEKKKKKKRNKKVMYLITHWTLAIHCLATHHRHPRQPWKPLATVSHAHQYRRPPTPKPASSEMGGHMTHPETLLASLLSLLVKHNTCVLFARE